MKKRSLRTRIEFVREFLDLPLDRGGLISLVQLYEKEKGIRRLHIAPPKTWRDIVEGEKTVIMGMYGKLWVPSEKTKYIEAGYPLIMPADVAKMAGYIFLARAGRRKLSYPRWAEEYLKIPPPAYYKGPGLYENMVMVDVNAAYWTVYSRYGLDGCSYLEVDHDRKVIRFVDIGLGRVFPSPEFGNLKVERNALYGITRKNTLQFWKKGTMEVRKVSSDLYNPGLSGLIFSFMHALAHHAVYECHAIWVWVDAYVFPIQFLEKFRNFAEFLGFSLKIKSKGTVIFRNILAYCWEDGRKTKNFEEAQVSHQKVEEVYKVEFSKEVIKWLEKGRT